MSLIYCIKDAEALLELWPTQMLFVPSTAIPYGWAVSTKPAPVRQLFLDEMEIVVPWSSMESLVRSHHAKAGHGHQPVGLSIMLRA